MTKGFFLEQEDYKRIEISMDDDYEIPDEPNCSVATITIIDGNERPFILLTDPDQIDAIANNLNLLSQAMRSATNKREIKP